MKDADSRNRGQAVLSAGHSRGRRRHHRRRNRHQQAHAVQSFSVQGRIDRGLSGAAASSRRAPSDKPPVEQILGTFDWLERRFCGQGFSRLPVRQRGRRTRRRPVGPKDRHRLQGKPPPLVSRSAGAARRRRCRKRLRPSSRLLVDGSIAQDLVRDDPAMARAAKEAAKVLLRNAGVKVGGSAVADRRRQEAAAKARFLEAPSVRLSLRKQGPIRRGLSVG